MVFTLGQYHYGHGCLFYFDEKQKGDIKAEEGSLEMTSCSGGLGEDVNRAAAEDG